MTAKRQAPTLSLGTQLRLQLFDTVADFALSRFEHATAKAPAVNRDTLRRIVRLNRHTEFGARFGLPSLDLDADLVTAFKAGIPLTYYTDYEPYVDRIAAGEKNILTSDEVTMLAGSSGTTSQPKRIPRTRRAQRKSMSLIVLAEQAAINRAIPGAKSFRRGINLMSLYQPKAESASAIPFTSGPNVGLQRMRRQIPVRWISPVDVFDVLDRPTAFYLHALFGLLDRDALYISSLFAPGVVGWFALIERRQDALVRDMADGTLPGHLQLTPAQREAITIALQPNRVRAEQVASIFAEGFHNIVPRLWPELKYVRTISTGSFAFSLPRLRWLVGDSIRIHSGSYVSAESVIGINIGMADCDGYVLACGMAYYEFIPVEHAAEDQPTTMDIEQLEVGKEYELVLTTYAGLYRYRLGDIVRISGFHKQAPVVQFLYRRGTVLSLAGEKSTEYHTATALKNVAEKCLGSSRHLRDYCIAASRVDEIPCYEFFVELDNAVRLSVTELTDLAAHLDQDLCTVNPYYWSNGRQAERLAGVRLNLVRPGTFDALLDLQLKRTNGVNTSLIKIPRLITRADHLTLLRTSSLVSATSTRPTHEPSAAKPRMLAG